MNRPATRPIEPIPAHDRIVVLDVLRGVALFGVLLVNLEALSGVGYWASSARYGGFWGGETTLGFATTVLLRTKALTLFSLLFGIGFAIQLERFAGHGFPAFFRRRMVILVIIGCLHAHLVWDGDILRFYGGWGLVRLGVRRLSQRALLGLGVFFAGPATAVIHIGSEVLPGPSLTSGLFSTQFQDAIRDVYASGSPTDVLLMNQLMVIRDLIQNGAITCVSTLGKFLLGMWIYRAGLLRREASAARRRRGWVIYGVLLGIPSSVALALVRHGHLQLTPGLAWLPLLVAIGLLLHALLYFEAVLRWAQSQVFPTVLTAFANVGRLALTNYLLQSVVAALLFRSFIPGVSWFGEVGPSGLWMIAVAVYGAQGLASSWWLSRYRFGPIEGLWRRLSYGSGRAPRAARL